ncbi:hypothetical protein [Candidatus Phytoplasma gossypii]|uniref:Uncharacterized protein n=1 Tax=Candidatus Phytoplasma gossypii TaxID=2982629 RepID=A0ABT9D4B5_9MOLU|nr:hypothetical protein ['Gossypium sp.' phytoplasma]MDO8057519.1 hypothetical protein ['Gossypium sp.' phytoplasma]
MNLKIFPISIMFFLTLIFSKNYCVYGCDKKNLLSASESNLYQQNSEKNIYQKSSEEYYIALKEKILDVAKEALEQTVQENYLPLFFDESKTDEEIVKNLQDISEKTLIGFMRAPKRPKFQAI